MLGYPSYGLNHHPTIIAEASGSNHGGLGGKNFVIELPFMRVTIDNLCEGLKSQCEWIKRPVPMKGNMDFLSF